MKLEKRIAKSLQNQKIRAILFIIIIGFGFWAISGDLILESGFSIDQDDILFPFGIINVSANSYYDIFEKGKFNNDVYGTFTVLSEGAITYQFLRVEPWYALEYTNVVIIEEISNVVYGEVEPLRVERLEGALEAGYVWRFVNPSSEDVEVKVDFYQHALGGPRVEVNLENDAWYAGIYRIELTATPYLSMFEIENISISIDDQETFFSDTGETSIYYDWDTRVYFTNGQHTIEIVVWDNFNARTKGIITVIAFNEQPGITTTTTIVPTTTTISTTTLVESYDIGKVIEDNIIVIIGAIFCIGVGMYMFNKKKK